MNNNDCSVLENAVIRVKIEPNNDDDVLQIKEIPAKSQAQRDDSLHLLKPNNKETLLSELISVKEANNDLFYQLQKERETVENLRAENASLRVKVNCVIARNHDLSRELDKLKNRELSMLKKEETVTEQVKTEGARTKSSREVKRRLDARSNQVQPGASGASQNTQITDRVTRAKARKKEDLDELADGTVEQSTKRYPSNHFKRNLRSNKKKHHL